MRILATRYFSDWAEADGLSNKKICKAIKELQAGLHDGRLGGEVYKKRIGIDSRGKRAGVRTIIAFRISSNVFCLYGYPKNERDNISDAEETAFKKAAAFYLNLNEVQIDSLVKKGELVEVKDA